MFTWVSAFGGIVSTKLLSDIEYVSQRYLPEYRRRVGERRAHVISLLDALRIPYTTPDAAFFIFVDLSQWLSHFDEAGDGDDDGNREIVLLEYLMARGIFLEPGRALMSTLPGYFRLSYGGGEDAFRLGMRRLVSALKELSGDKESLVVSVDGRQNVWRSFWPCCTSEG